MDICLAYAFFLGLASAPIYGRGYGFFPGLLVGADSHLIRIWPFYSCSDSVLILDAIGRMLLRIFLPRVVSHRFLSHSFESAWFACVVLALVSYPALDICLAYAFFLGLASAPIYGRDTLRGRTRHGIGGLFGDLTRVLQCVE